MNKVKRVLSLCLNEFIARLSDNQSGELVNPPATEQEKVHVDGIIKDLAVVYEFDKVKAWAQLMEKHAKRRGGIYLRIFLLKKYFRGIIKKTRFQKSTL